MEGIENQFLLISIVLNRNKGGVKAGDAGDASASRNKMFSANLVKIWINLDKI